MKEIIAIVFAVILPLSAAVPTPQQNAWQDAEFGVFFHCNRGNFYENFNPSQWADAAYDAGAKYIVFVAKHGDSFCWWQTTTTMNSVKSMAWKSGEGDVVAEVFAACRAKGLKCGFYLQTIDPDFGATNSGFCPGNQAAYNAYYATQINELCTNYGEIFEIWFDGGMCLSLDSVVYPIIEEHQPDAMIFEGPHRTIRWIGNEEGIAPYPTWNTTGGNWIPAECDVSISGGWFGGVIKYLSELETIYYSSVGRGANLLLNMPPQADGAMPQSYIDTAKALGELIQSRVGNLLAQTSGTGNTLELRFGTPLEIDHIISMEDILAGGERVTAYTLEGDSAGTWKTLCSGTAIGHKKIDRISPMLLSAVRLTCTASSNTPIIRSLYVTRTGVASVDSTPPTVPTGLAALPSGAYAINLSWSASTDTGSRVAHYHIYRDGVKLASVDGLTLTFTDNVVAESTTYEYEVSAANPSGTESARSAAVAATTSSDVVAPTLVSVAALSYTRVRVRFSETLDSLSAVSPANYLLDRETTVDSVALEPGGNSVILATSPLWENGNYLLTVNNISDRGIISNTIVPNSQISLVPMLAPVHHWKFDETDGNILHDEGRPAATDTVHGGFSWVSGRVGGAMQLDGAGGYANIGLYPDCRGQFTLSLWAKPEIAAGHVLSRGRSGDASYILALYLDGNQKWQFEHSDDFGRDFGLWTNFVSGRITAGEWMHMAVTCADTVYLMYINGIEVKRWRVTATINQPYNPYPGLFGASMGWTGPTSFFKGLIDDMRIYNRTLDSNDVRLIMQPGDSLTTALPLSETKTQVLQLAAYPNPFNPAVTIRLTGVEKPVRLGIFDLQGKAVVDLRNAFRNGSVTWKAGAPSGVYIVRAEISGHKLVKRIILIK